LEKRRLRKEERKHIELGNELCEETRKRGQYSAAG
jgi:hypothetical protein